MYIVLVNELVYHNRCNLTFITVALCLFNNQGFDAQCSGRAEIVRNAGQHLSNFEHNCNMQIVNVQCQRVFNITIKYGSSARRDCQNIDKRFTVFFYLIVVQFL